jgi:hypothetical protein
MGKSTKYDVKANHDKREYYVVERDTDKVIASFKYKPKELDRGVAHGRANILRHRLNGESK